MVIFFTEAKQSEHRGGGDAVLAGRAPAGWTAGEVCRMVDRLR
jgi:hypothetical protein